MLNLTKNIFLGAKIDWSDFFFWKSEFSYNKNHFARIEFQRNVYDESVRPQVDLVLRINSKTKVVKKCPFPGYFESE